MKHKKKKRPAKTRGAAPPAKKVDGPEKAKSTAALPSAGDRSLEIPNVFRKWAKSTEPAVPDAAAIAGTALPVAKKRYVEALAARPDAAVPTAEDILALQAVAGDGGDLVGKWRVVTAVVIVAVTILVFAVGLQKAPITRIELRAVADRVAVQLSEKTVSSSFQISSAAPVEKLNFLGATTGEAILGSAADRKKNCPIDVKERAVTLSHPEQVKLIYSPGASLTFSAIKKVGVNQVDEVLIDGRGTFTLKAFLPSTDKPIDDCDHFKGDVWSGPANITLSPPSEVTNMSMNIWVSGGEKEAMPATAVLGLPRLDASKVTFDDVGVDFLQWGATPTRCSIRSGSIEYLQRVPLVKIESLGRSELRNRQCPISNSKALDSKIWLGPSESGLFEVIQRIESPDGIGSMYVDGALPGRELGKSYLEIIKEDPGLTLIIGIATLIMSNLWSFAQLLRRWLK